jgi:LPS export ABC transporter protein LptC
MTYNSILPFLKSIVLILLGTMLFSCENDLSAIKALKVDENTPISTTYNMTMVYTDSGKLMMKMESPEVNQYLNDDDYLEMPKGINLIFYDSTKQVRSSLKADYAINYTKTKIMEAQNNVVAVNAQGQQLYTERLIWDQNKHLIYTNNKVRVVTEGKILFGDGLEADETFEKWVITNPSGDIEFNQSEFSDTITQ